MTQFAEIEFVFGGSFDPVHSGHLNLIDHLKQFSPGWGIRVLLCATPPLKRDSEASFDERVEMLKIALTGYQGVSIDQREKEREGKSFTFDSLQELRKDNLACRLILVVGADVIESLEQWYRCKELCKLCHLVVVNRPQSQVKEMGGIMQTLGFICAETKQELELDPVGRYHCLTIEEKNVSSKDIRLKLANKQSVRQLLPNDVVEYINERQLY